MTATELKELMAANGFDHLPYYQPGTDDASGDGYIAIEEGSVEAASVHDTRVQVVSGKFTRSGTRQSHRRSLHVQPQRVHRNDYGNATGALVSIPSAASKRTWYKRETQERAPVSATETIACEGGDVDLVDAATVDLPAPYELVYDIPYDEEPKHNIILWDDRSVESRHDGDLAWARAYRTSHEFCGVPIIDTGNIRIHLDETTGITVDQYTDTTWTTLDLPPTDWHLHDVDITTISPIRIEAHLTFTHTNSDDSYTLRMLARRGRATTQFTVPSSVSTPTPSGLRDSLAPIADPSVRRPTSHLGLIARKEVRR
ncbi:hypothetical protein [Halobacterium sp. BOL4-2]|uniref:hypothetical protein n=1 Tax=Halobacterium sp. BOL4-2 TaxID=2810537 RepID=UPI001964B5BE|nr:hypothetical protein [Halobacterium sp. BOL4-2]QRY26355.1 hypothetical protein JRZ79_13265 [Halobacterium sp. BOL4-2]